MFGTKSETSITQSKTKSNSRNTRRREQKKRMQAKQEMQAVHSTKQRFGPQDNQLNIILLYRWLGVFEVLCYFLQNLKEKDKTYQGHGQSLQNLDVSWTARKLTNELSRHQCQNCTDFVVYTLMHKVLYEVKDRKKFLRTYNPNDELNVINVDSRWSEKMIIDLKENIEKSLSYNNIPDGAVGYSSEDIEDSDDSFE